jgi:putative SOS response-associated peptidase YedK
MSDRTGNMPPLPGIYPDYRAPIVRNQPDGRELTMARLGLPSPLYALKGKKSDPGVTNVRNVGSPHWRRWLGVENRCLVPFTSFAENEHLPDGRRPRCGSHSMRRVRSHSSPAFGPAGPLFGR